MKVKIINRETPMWYQIDEIFDVDPEIVKSMLDKDSYIHKMKNGIGFINVGSQLP